SFDELGQARVLVAWCREFTKVRRIAVSRGDEPRSGAAHILLPVPRTAPARRSIEPAGRRERQAEAGDLIAGFASRSGTEHARGPGRWDAPRRAAPAASDSGMRTLPLQQRGERR